VQNLSPKAQTFDFYSLRFEFSALGPFAFPALLSANIFRGAFGLVLRRISARTYGEIFAPVASAPGPSGLLNPPRPFVFRTRHLAGRTVSPGETFHIELNVFIPDEDRMDRLLHTLHKAFEEMAATGFVPQRSRARLFDSSMPPRLFSLPISAVRLRSFGRFAVTGATGGTRWRHIIG